MGTPRTWLPRAKEIIEVLQRMKSPHLDRPAIEELFQLQRRTAIILMQQAGATAERGSASQVSRTSLLAWVEKIVKEEYWQICRRQTVREELSQSMAEVQAIRQGLRDAGRPPVPFSIVEEVLSATCASLPEEIRLRPGRIVIDLNGDDAAQSACKSLYALGMAIANDYAGFEAAVQSSQPEGSYDISADIVGADIDARSGAFKISTMLS